uniref:PorT family protein n=1 Tax=uncultured Sphingobacteriales bacterium HF0130_33B19 TaxID=710991 RepID=E0XTP7_9SPHI|nr:hypothetical protein [uncultured Sphingobacteriales bacterium HF0130_33B19]
MKPVFFSILFSILSTFVFSQNYDAKSSSLANTGITQNGVWSNFTNQAGIAEINKFTVGLGIENSFLLSELSTKSVACAIPVKSGVFGANISYTGFELYNESKIGLAFAKKLSDNFKLAVQLDYLGIYTEEGTNNINKFTFEIGAQKKLTKNLTLGAHIFNPEFSYNEIKTTPSIFKLGIGYDVNQKVLAFTEVELESEEDAKLKIAIEYKIIPQMQIRTGFYTNPNQNTFGIGYTLDKIQFDIAIKKHYILGYSPLFSISSAF